MADRPIVHLFSQAHIDPVWMWGWEEGAREALSTFYTAADLLDEFPEYVFNHNESLIYEWVEEYAPPLFERIQTLVKAGRWNVTGGWYLQPDCNLPGGETLVRLILEGRRYFDEKFGVRPKIAYNFDTFGHPGSLPQILAQSGFEMYIHFRPNTRQMDVPDSPYTWQGIDGTQVIGLRPHDFWYCTPQEGRAEAQARRAVEIARETGRDVLVTWGMGDHGGGASRKDLHDFRQLIAEYADSGVEIRHSTPEAYLERLRAQSGDSFPVKVGELQRTLAGCYTSVAPIKRQMRQSEALLSSAERWAAIAWWRLGWRYPQAELREAWKRVMFNTFHDVLCGSLIEDAIPGVMDMYGYALDTARRIVVRSQHALISSVEPKEDTIPFYVYNPHSTAVRAPIACNFLNDYKQPVARKPYNLYDDREQRVTSQTDGGPAVQAAGVWQPFVGFIADVPPLTSRRYEIRFEPAAPQTTDRLAVREDAGGLTVENAFWSARFDRALAAAVALTPKASGRNLLNGPAQLFAMDDVGHAWGGEYRSQFNTPVSALAALSPSEVGAYVGLEGQEGPALRVIAQGPVSVTVECLVGWQHTRASIKYTFYADLPSIDVDVRLFMQARRKMLKLSLPFDLAGVRATVEVPYGAAERAADATEWPYSRWLQLTSADGAVGLANNGQNGFDISADGLLNLSLTRGGIHTSWEGDEDGAPTDINRSYTFMDQAQIDTRFRLLAGDDTAALIAAALELNQPLERFYGFHLPRGTQPEFAPFLSVEPANVVLGTLKKAERDDALIVRLVEEAGEPTTASVTFEGQTQSYDFRPYEIKTLKLWKEGRWQPVNLIEEPV